MSLYSLDKLISETRRVAAEYRRTTGKTLGGVSGEIAEYDAARILDLELLKQKPGGYDAVGRGKRDGDRVQIKGRAIFEDSKSSQRIGQLKLDQDWDTLVLVILDDDFEPVEIYEASRETVENALEEAAAGKRNKKGAMTLARFKHIAHLVWTPQEGQLDDDAPGSLQGS